MEGSVGGRAGARTETEGGGAEGHRRRNAERMNERPPARALRPRPRRAVRPGDPGHRRSRKATGAAPRAARVLRA